MKMFGCVSITYFLLVWCAIAAGAIDHTGHDMKAPVSSDPCRAGKDCISCAKKGCNWCSSSEPSGSFCTASNFSEAGCNAPGCSADTFYSTVAQCSGGCSQQMECGDCYKIPGCGWCHRNDYGSACMEAPLTGEAPATCHIWAGHDSTNCSIPCEMRTGCDNCVGGPHDCMWCGGKCKQPSASNKHNKKEDATCVSSCQEYEQYYPKERPYPGGPPPPFPPSNNNNNKNSGNNNAKDGAPPQGDVGTMNPGYLGVVVVGFVVVISMAAVVRHYRKSANKSDENNDENNDEQYVL